MVVPRRWWLWLLMPVSMLAFWGLVIWVVTVVRSAGGSQPLPGGTSDPERILGERFARGELDASEYEQRLATLRDRTHTAA